MQVYYNNIAVWLLNTNKTKHSSCYLCMLCGDIIYCGAAVNYSRYIFVGKYVAQNVTDSPECILTKENYTRNNFEVVTSRIIVVITVYHTSGFALTYWLTTVHHKFLTAVVHPDSHHIWIYQRTCFAAQSIPGWVNNRSPIGLILFYDLTKLFHINTENDKKENMLCTPQDFTQRFL